MQTETEEKPEVLEPDVFTEVNAPLVSGDAAAQLLAAVAPLVPRIAEYKAYAESLTIRTAEDAKGATAKLDAIRADINIVKGAMEPHTAEADRRHKLLTAFRARFVDPFTASGKMIKDKAMAYEQAEAARIEEQRRKLQAEADERARREREKAEQAAREQREKEEAARRASEEARLKAEAASGEERARLQAEADKREREANAAKAKAEQKETTAAQVAAPVIHIPAPKSGIRARKDVTVEILSIEEFVKAAAANPMLCGYIDQPSLAAALKRAKASNPMFNVPGVRFSERTV